MIDNLYQRAGVWWVNLNFNKSRYRRSTGTKEYAAACIVRDSLRASINGRHGARFMAAQEDDLLLYLVRRKEGALRRDRKRGRIPTLSKQELDVMWNRCGGKCEVTGIPFSLYRAAGTMRRPYAPSLHRIDNSLPYTYTNVQIVCVAINIAINEWGENIFRDLAFGFLARKRVGHTFGNIADPENVTH